MTKGYLRTTWLLACFFLTSLALCQEAVTLRYAWVPGTSLSWTLEMKASGSGALTTPQGTTEMPMNVNVSMPLFLDVLEVPGEGIAKVRLSLGLIVTEISTPMGDVIRTETDLKTGRVTTRLREAVEVTELPEAARGLVVNSVEMVLDSRGQVKELRLPDEVRAAMSRAMQGLTAGAGDLSQWVGWLAPILPEGPVAPGAT
ncbi:MAG: hypothetical protein N2512_06615, partial [Armatimonadetes bacterium]|nr:hypothetical protein [Armatimonadota bacterium]